MRGTLGILACVVVGGTSLLRADPPVTPSAPSAASAPATPQVARPATSAAPSVAPAAEAAATADAAAKTTEHPTSAAPAANAEAAVIIEADDAEAKRLRAAGYRPEMVNGEQIWCRRENTLGSRLDVQKTCGTAKSLALSVQETKDRFIATQNKQWNPTAK